MGWASIGLLLGVAGNGPATVNLDLDAADVHGDIEARRGFYMALPIRLGGDGLAFLLQPVMQMSKVNYRKRDSYGNDFGIQEASVVGLGAYLGPDYYARVSKSIYVGGGFGFKGLYSSDSAFDYAGELSVRVPVHVSYYVTRTLGVIGEVGVGYGGAVFASAPQPSFDPYSGDISLDAGDPRFGFGWTWDVSFGVSLP